MGRRLGALALAVAGVLAGAGAVGADLIHLTNGSSIEVEAWRDVGDAIEFTLKGGVVQVPKAEVLRIDGAPTRRDLSVTSAPLLAPAALAAPRGPLTRGQQAALALQMASVLARGWGVCRVFGLSAAEQTASLRQMADWWGALGVPEPLRAAHARGEQAFRLVRDPSGSPCAAPERIEAAFADASVTLEGALTRMERGGKR